METRTPAEVSEADEAIREVLACLPEPLAQRLGPVRFAVRASDEDVASRWCWGEAGVEVEVNESETSPHDCALEVLWEEIEAGVEGEIDERALREKRADAIEPHSRSEPSAPGAVRGGIVR